VVTAGHDVTLTARHLEHAEKAAAEELQELLPTATVVKGFNTVFSSRLGDPVEKGMPAPRRNWHSCTSP
jgi:predicted dinucleotide-binding enzyme